MKRNLSIAAVLMLAAASAYAGDVLVAGEFASENVIVETREGPAGGFGAYEWKDEYPFPRHIGPVD